jgi:hypothetical protein
MKGFHKWLLAALLLVLLGCAGPREHVHPVDPFGLGPSWWGMDAVCSPGCPVGPSGSW